MTDTHCTYAGADWLQRQNRALAISEFGGRVADTLGQVYCGLYHLSNTALFHKRTRWDDDTYIKVVTRGRLTQADLIALVEQCRQHSIHVEIDGASNGYMQLLFFSELATTGVEAETANKETSIKGH